MPKRQDMVVNETDRPEILEQLVDHVVAERELAEGIDRKLVEHVARPWAMTSSRSRRSAT